MSYYYNQKFVSPEPIFALIKEELRSYFAPGLVDDLLFSTYVDKCLRRLGRSTYKIEPAILWIEEFEAVLPSDFYAVREAWSCVPVHSNTRKTPGSIYQQVTVNIGEIPAPSPCTECTGLPDIVTVTYKSNDTETYTYTKSKLLKPGNISKHPECGLECSNYGSSSYDSFDVRGNKFFTNFRCGHVYLLYYSEELDENDNQLIPDNFRVKEYIEAFLKYKIFEQLCNTVTDESYKIIENKKQQYEQKYNEAFVLAYTELSKETPYDKQRAIKRTLNRNNRYKLPNGTRRLYYRR